MNLPVESLLEQAVSRQVNNLIADTNLNTIVKMSLLLSPDFDETQEREYESILAKIKTNNVLEQYYIDQEYQLTYDCAGNIIPVKCITENEREESKEKSTTDLGSVVSESQRSETETK